MQVASDNDEPYNMILLLGLTGSGKSFFINKLAKDAVIEGPGLKSETQRCKVVRMKVGNQYVAIVDTPGFDDTKRTDAEILEEIVQFLVFQYTLGIPLKGIIYMHRIIDVKMQGTSQRYFEMFRRICGEKNFPNVVLLTTMWDQLKDEGVGLRRDQELRDDFWNKMEEMGSQIRSFDGSEAMAEAIICRLMRKKSIVLDIQRELVDQDMALDQTNAGKLLLPRLEDRMRETAVTLRTLDADISSSHNSRDVARRSQLLQQRAEVSERRERDVRSRDRLKSKPARELAPQIEQAKNARLEKWRNRVQIFAALLGLAITATVQLILPLAGVAIT
ncbi:P-loop containing nucleoside triphosphate hydrolase protein [Microthyrium microscopicum]|uniref:P-loop containing nucleoside triphosphate hydrolase protein n=1 Tax=Microthyrium microscopicum TaxID=703497 RepID=A0A6A6US08_9PEZI|nr:P-loop containing nucleoside triphosphate hydrolase protein [Microthyrium microscopicum]